MDILAVWASGGTKSERTYAHVGNSASEPKDWECPTTLQWGRLGMHVPLHCFDSVASALVPAPGEPAPPSAWTLPLTPARWSFLYAPSVELAPTPSKAHAGFDTSSGAWGTIETPLSWEMAGHGAPHYTNIMYPFDYTLSTPEAEWDVRPRLEGNAAGCYQVRFSLPADWAGRRVFLHLGGVESAVHVWLDGRDVGYSTDSRLPAEFELSELLALARSGGSPARTHTLSLRVYRFSAGSYLEDQDHWWLSGLHRHVRLFSKPAEAAIVDYCATSEVWWGASDADGRAHASAALVRVDVSLQGAALDGAGAERDGRVTLGYELRGPYMLGGADAPGADALVASGASEVVRVPAAERVALAALEPTDHRAHTLAAARTARATCELRVGAPRLWSAEAPWLYRLVVTVRVGREVRDVEACWLGLREVRIANAQLCVNGRPVRVRGVNRHDHCPRGGKAVSRELMVRDVTLMKQLNFNAVRTSHYPNASAWYELCDAHGLYVVDEANLETHGFRVGKGDDGFLAKRPAWRGAYVARSARMVARDRNHACVIVWSLGNEAGCGANLEHAYAQLKAMDPSRPVQYEPCGALGYTDIICPMYPSARRLRALGTLDGQRAAWRAYPAVRPADGARPRATADSDGACAPAAPPAGAVRRPVIMCEYSHAMGNSNGNFAQFWEAVRDVDCVQGGFVWDWVDQGLDLRAAAARGGTATALALGADGAAVRPPRARGQADADAGFPRPAAHATDGADGRRNAWGYGGDFGEAHHDAQFCINGLVWPDRTPHPACYEVKHAQQPVRLQLLSWQWSGGTGLDVGGAGGAPGAAAARAAADGVGEPDVVGEGVVRVHNEFDFISLEHLAVSSDVRLRGRVAHASAHGAALRAPAGKSADLAVRCALPLALVRRALRTERGDAPCAHLDISLALAADTPWAAAGHEVASAQFALPPLAAALPQLAAVAAVAARAGADDGAATAARPRVRVSAGATSSELRLHTARGDFCFDRTSGHLISVIGLDRRERLSSPCALQFWRAPTDNDNGGVEILQRWLWAMPSVHRFVLSLLPRLPHRLLRLVGGCAGGQGVDGGADGGLQNLVSYRTLWTREGWDRLERRSEEAARVVFEPDGSVSVRSASVLVDPASGAARVRATVDARVSADGHAWLAATCDVRTALPSVPRVGFRLGVRRALGAAVSWLGRGPHENYDDRKLGARLAVHALDADAMHTPYIVPGENGLRCDVEWLALRDAAGGGLLLAAEPAMMAAVSPYSTAELERATHDHELCASDELTVSLDHAHMGVGGDDSWSRSVYAEHLVGAGRYTWTLGIVPLAPGDDADEAAQEALLAMPDAATTAARQARARVARRAVSAESTTGFGGCCRPC